MLVDERQGDEKLDRLDYISFTAIILLSTFAGFLAVKAYSTPLSQTEIKQANKVLLQVYDPELDNRIKLVRNLLNNNLSKCRELLNTIVVSYPFNAEVFMLEGDYFLRRQMPISAMHSYRMAIDLNLDYLDKKTTLYQGKKIRNTVGEATRVIKKDLADHPGDDDLIKAKKEMRYMKRRIAGSCSS